MTCIVHYGNIAIMQTGHQRLVAYRDRHKLKLVEFATLLGMNFTHLSKILSGKKRPGLATVLKIEAVTGIPASAWSDSMYAKSDRRRALADRKAKLANEISHV